MHRVPNHPEPKLFGLLAAGHGASKIAKNRAPRIFETRQIYIFNFNPSAILSMPQFNYIVIKTLQKDLCKNIEKHGNYSPSKFR